MTQINLSNKDGTIHLPPVDSEDIIIVTAKVPFFEYRGRLALPEDHCGRANAIALETTSIVKSRSINFVLVKNNQSRDMKETTFSNPDILISGACTFLGQAKDLIPTGSISTEYSQQQYWWENSDLAHLSVSDTQEVESFIGLYKPKIQGKGPICFNPQLELGPGL